MKFLTRHRHKALFIWYILLFYILVIPISYLVQTIYFQFDPQSLTFINELIASGASETQLLSATALPNSIMNVTIYTLAAIPMFMLLHDELDTYFMQAWNDKKTFLKQVVIGYLIMFALSAVASIIMTLLNIVDSSANQTGVEAILSTSPLLSVITVVFLAPFVEEIVFRYLLIRGLKRFVPIGVAATISIVLFALIHVLEAGDFINIIPYLALGAGLTIAYVRTDNIMVAIAIHFIQNFIAILVMMGL
ncbi:MAG: lysostaphin resistance A-like protein [Culicoidibacterales bacterium]